VLTASVPVPEAGLSFSDLYEQSGLVHLDALFLARLKGSETALHEDLILARQNANALAPKQESELLIALAPHVDDFLGWLFGIENEVTALTARHHELNPIFGVKRNFVQRKAMHKIKSEDAEGIDGLALARKLEALFGESLTELSFARHVLLWQQDEALNRDALELALKYAAQARSPAPRACSRGQQRRLRGLHSA
jgi:hypothetical protein